MISPQRPTPVQLSLDREIQTPGIILAEGRTLEMFLRELIEKDLQLEDRVEARTFGEKEASNLKLFLNAFATKAEAWVPESVNPERIVAFSPGLDRRGTRGRSYPGNRPRKCPQP